MVCAIKVVAIIVSSIFIVLQISIEHIKQIPVLISTIITHQECHYHFISICICIWFVFVFLSTRVLEGGSKRQDSMVWSINNVTNTSFAIVSHKTAVEVDTYQVLSITPIGIISAKAFIFRLKIWNSSGTPSQCFLELDYEVNWQFPALYGAHSLELLCLIGGENLKDSMQRE